VLVIGATNLPENVDDAVVRRLSERIFVGHPDRATRLAMLAHHLRSERHSLTQRDIAHLADVTEGYSASDLRALCKEAALEPLSAVPREQFVRMRKEDVPPVSAAHAGRRPFAVLSSTLPRLCSRRSLRRTLPPRCARCGPLSHPNASLHTAAGHYSKAARQRLQRPRPRWQGRR
jgi:SpoVK/Ycf46/Vps4 family AAA+-type ATPase